MKAWLCGYWYEVEVTTLLITVKPLTLFSNECKYNVSAKQKLSEIKDIIIRYKNG